MAEGINKLSEEGLYDCMKSLKVPTQLSDIKTPTKEFLIRVFEYLFKDLQIDIMHPDLRPHSAIKHIDYPDVTEGGQSINLLIMFINIITCGDGLKLYVRDIIFPKPKRTKKILNYLIVFWKYFLIKYANFQAIAEKFQSELEEAECLSEENDKLDQKYKEFSSVLSDALPSKEELISCNASKVEKCKELETQREALTEENSATKKKENDLHTFLTTTDVNIVTAKEQIKELAELILSSPDKIGTEIKKLKDLIREEEIKIREKESDLKDKKKDLDTLKQIIESGAKDLEEVKNINKSLETFGEVVKSFILDFQKYQEEKENLKKLESQLQIKEDLQSINEHKFAKIHLQFKKQKESYIETCDMLKRNLTQEQDDLICLKADNCELDKKMDKEVETILKTVDRCKEAEKNTEKLQKSFKSKMETIVSTFASECGDIKKFIAKTCTI